MGKKKPSFRSWACHCGIKLSVSERDLDKHLVPDRFKCWAPKCRFYFKRDDSLVVSGVAEARFIYQMISGLGTKAESDCSTGTLRKVLYGQKIAEVALESISSTRSLVTSMRLESGKTIHFAPSTKGVTIYKVTDE